MSTIRTQLTHLEDARRWRFEPTSTIQETNVQRAIERAAASPTTVDATTVNAAMSPYYVQGTDTVLMVDTTGGAVTINLQSSELREGLALEIYDNAGNADTNAITIVPAGVDTGGIDGLETLVINSAYGGARLIPDTVKYKTSDGPSGQLQPGEVWGNSSSGQSVAFPSTINGILGRALYVNLTGPSSSVKTFTLPNASETIATLGQNQTWNGTQTFNDGKLVLAGASSGQSILKASTTGGGTATLFSGSDTIVGAAAAQTLTNKTINAASNTVSGLTTAMFAANVIDNDGTLGANSSSRVPTQAAVKAALDALIAAADAMVFKGAIDCSANPNYPAADRGWTYKVSVAGKIGGASGVNVEVGDMLLCITDGTASGTQAAVGAQWNIIQSNIDGAVIGPASSTSGNIATFNGTGGKVIQDGGKALPASAIVGISDVQALTGKTYNGLTITTTTGTFTLAAGKTLTASSTLTLTGTDGSSVAFGAGGTVAYVTNKLSVFAATTSSELAGVISDKTGTGSLVFGSAPELTNPNVGTQLISDYTDKAASTKWVTDKVAAVSAGVTTFGGQSGVITVPGGSFSSGAVSLLRYDASQSLSGGEKTQVFTNLGLGAASTSAAGLVALATAAEAMAGTNSGKAVTPAALAGAQSLAASGYHKLPGGLIIQWGSATPTSGQSSVTFPVAFPTAAVAVVATLYNGGFGTTDNLYCYTQNAPTTTGFSMSHRYIPSGGTPVAANQPAFWIAMGY